MAETMRLDRFLWFARISASRGYAQALATGSHLRIDGKPCTKPAHPVRVGQVLTFAAHRGDVRTLRIDALPARRGPLPEARACYTDLAANVSQQDDGN